MTHHCSHYRSQAHTLTHRPSIHRIYLRCLLAVPIYFYPFLHPLHLQTQLTKYLKKIIYFSMIYAPSPKISHNLFFASKSTFFAHFQSFRLVAASQFFSACFSISLFFFSFRPACIYQRFSVSRHTQLFKPHSFSREELIYTLLSNSELAPWFNPLFFSLIFGPPFVPNP